MRICYAPASLVLVWLFCYSARCGIGNYIPCSVCGSPLGSTVFQFTDKITRASTVVCERCTLILPRCFLCGMPALTNLAGCIKFEDSRMLCARDAQTAVVQEEEGVRIATQIREYIDREFSRFLSLPETNINFRTVDRLHLENLFKIVGQDYECPNVMGITQETTNAGTVGHKISVLVGLPRAEFKAVCAHECAHVWLEENLSEERKKNLSLAAREGFCELLAYLCMDQLQEHDQKKMILANLYTRGQIALFVEAARDYGFNDVIDWMRFGVDDRLKEGDLLRVRTLGKPIQPGTPPPTMPVTWVSAPARTYDNLTLKAIFWDPKQPSALVNDRTLAPGEQSILRVGGTNVTVRCQEIRKDSVRLKFLNSAEEEVLHLRSAP